VGEFYEAAGGSMFLRLYDAFGLDLRGFTCRAPKGPEPNGLLTPGRHELVVGVSDAWDNSREAAVPFVYGSLPTFTRFALRRDSTGIDIDFGVGPVGAAVDIFYRSDRTWYPLSASGREDGSARILIGPESRMEVRCVVEDPSGLVREGVLVSGAGAAERDTSVDVWTEVHPGFVEVYAALGSPPSSLPEVSVREGGQGHSLLLQPIGENRFRVAYLPVTESGAVRFQVEVEFDRVVVDRTVILELGLLKPGREIWLSTEHYRVRLAAPDGYASRTLVAISEAAGRVPQGFLTSAEGLVLEPAEAFFNEAAEVVIVRKDGGLTARYGVFAEAGEWVVFRGRFDGRGRCTFTTRRPERLAVLEDGDGPEMGPVRDLKSRPEDGKATFASRIVDRGSGVDAGSLRAFVDDDVAIVSIDPDTGVVNGRTTKPLQSGDHRIRLVAEDRMGNASVREFTVLLSR
jgi:hypothetical protein